MIKTDNQKQSLFIQALFNSAKKQERTLKIRVVEKQKQIPYTVEVSNYTNGNFLLYRVAEQEAVDYGLWGTWKDEEEATNWFKKASFM